MNIHCPASRPDLNQPLFQTEPFHIVLHEPEIPPNTGNILRLAAATGSILHLVGALGFRLDAAGCRRAGMDYRQLAVVRQHGEWRDYLRDQPPNTRIFALSTHGGRHYAQCAFQPGDRFLFGSEGCGLPVAIREMLAENLLRIPMLAPARSLNLANSVAIVLYEALRQQDFPGLA